MTDSIVLSEGRERRSLVVKSVSSRTIRISSHYPFWRVNARLQFDRSAAEGFRLDIPAGTTIAWSPGETREVALVAFAATSGAG